MKLRWPVLLMLLGLVCNAARAEGEAVRERLSLDEGWLFHLGDVPMRPLVGHDMSYNNAKAGNAGVAWEAAGPDYDDSAWRKLDLPHDWAVEGPFDPKANESQGYRPRGFGWYRRYLQLDEGDKDKHFELQFDGIASHCTVWFNGTVVHRNFWATIPSSSTSRRSPSSARRSTPSPSAWMPRCRRAGGTKVPASIAIRGS